MSDNESESTPVTLSPIANPLVSDKKTKRVLKLVKKGLKVKYTLRGIKAVNKAIRKNQSGIVILAGDSAPIDIIAHLPGLCEETKNVSFAFVKSKQDLGTAVLSKRPCCAVMILQPADGDELRSLYDKVAKVVKRASSKDDEDEEDEE
ncbi:H/ACA ribonucleoprotein complex subunit 2 [Acrasis kona]|uniref:H/ACA ribonucleoprotein complex subunit 2 n=1 Tax=Acrasis kona TaxID=1008807 RepID=A0AAW2YHG3_9EUKA